jgi:hypothetical protein
VVPASQKIGETGRIIRQVSLPTLGAGWRVIIDPARLGMARSWLVLLLFIPTIPAFAGPPKAPTPCSELWPAVKATLSNGKNYIVVAMDSEEMKANFVVKGALYPQLNLVQLKDKKKGCDLDLRIGFTGADDEGAFRTRVHRAFKRMNAAKVSVPSNTGPAQ